jgi:transcriptional regulator with XRE-family HTH domain
MVNNLRILRVRAGLTQKELAAETGMAQSKVSLYESLDDLSKLQVGTLIKIADVCGVKIDDIINPLPPLTPADEMLDFVSATYIKDKEDAENGDVEAIIQNRFA